MHRLCHRCCNEDRLQERLWRCVDELDECLPFGRRWCWRPIPSSVRIPLRKTSVTATRKRLKITGAITQPCLTPILTINGSDSWQPTTTLAVIPSWNSLKTANNCGGQPNLLSIPHITSNSASTNSTSSNACYYFFLPLRSGSSFSLSFLYCRV